MKAFCAAIEVVMRRRPVASLRLCQYSKPNFEYQYSDLCNTKSEKMEICDENGNLCEGFLNRLEKLKNQQVENVRLLDSMRIDAQIEVQKKNNNASRTSEIDEQIHEMWRDFDLTQRIIGIGACLVPRDIPYFRPADLSAAELTIFLLGSLMETRRRKNRSESFLSKVQDLKIQI